MASRTTSRRLQCITKRIRPACQCTSQRASSIRQLSASAPRKAEWEIDKGERPRWSYTPEQMKAPFPWRPKDPANAFEINSDPGRLDRFYISFLGRGGDKMLTEEVKWLAVTHKSFDQGRRGFNDRLAFFGRRILILQTNLALLNSPTPPNTQRRHSNPSEMRIPFDHPALEGLSNLSGTPMGEILTKSRLAAVATQAGMRDIMRWQPRFVQKLETSGIEVVLNSCLFAIIGGIALQKGEAVAVDVAKEKILKSLGII